MLKNGINLQVHYIRYIYRNTIRKNLIFQKLIAEAEKFYLKAVSLPIYYSLDKRMVNKIIKKINLLTK